MSTTCLGGEFYHLFVGMFGVQLISSSICMGPKMTLMRSNSSSRCCSLPFFKTAMKPCYFGVHSNDVWAGCLIRCVFVVRPSWLFFRKTNQKIWNCEVLAKNLHSFSLGNLLSLKGDNIFGRKQGPQFYSNAAFSGETKGFSKENKRRNLKKDHMWLLGISHLQQIRRHLFQADESELGRSDHIAPFLHKKHLLFCEAFSSPQNFFTKKMKQISYPPNFWNPQKYGTQILPSPPGAKTSKPEQVKLPGESGAPPRYPGKLLRSMATSAVPFAHDGVDGWMDGQEVVFLCQHMYVNKNKIYIHIHVCM